MAQGSTNGTIRAEYSELGWRKLGAASWRSPADSSFGYYGKPEGKNETSDMTETTTIVMGAAIAVVLWLAWAFFSDTRRNHGFWVAFLLPLAPVIIPLLWLTYVLIKYPSYLVFVALGRRGEHEEFMRKVKTRSGVFLHC
jgi:hypothetical protein